MELRLGFQGKRGGVGKLNSKSLCIQLKETDAKWGPQLSFLSVANAWSSCLAVTLRHTPGWRIKLAFSRLEPQRDVLEEARAVTKHQWVNARSRVREQDFTLVLRGVSGSYVPE